MWYFLPAPKALSGEATDLRDTQDAALAGFVRSALTEFTPVQAVEADGEKWYMTGAPISTVGWTVLNAISAASG